MKACTTIAERLVADEPALLGSLDFGPWVAQGTGDGPTLLIGDQSEISLLSGTAGKRLDYRMAHLAQPGDVVLVRRRDPAFEAYLEQRLALTNVSFIESAPPETQSVAKHVLMSPQLIDKLAMIARQRGGLTLKSYLTTGNVWRMAQAIGEAAGLVVHVCGPSPRVAKRANDKLWFSRLARAVLGQGSTPATMSAYGPAATAALVSRISKNAAQVIVKIPDSAGSAGNVRINSTILTGKTIAQIRAFLMDRLHATGWQDRYPVLVGVWDDMVQCSPSVQLWIPRTGQGPPIAEGVFEQSVMSEAAAFVGAGKSRLPMAVQARLVSDACTLAAVLQQVGYYGRCSFDAVICADTTIHWIECNGRWGGVSIPMTAATSPVLGHFEGLMIMQETIPDVWINTATLLQKLDGLLFRHTAPANGVVVLSPPTSPHGTMVNVMAVADTQRAAQELGQQTMRILRAST